MRRYLGLALLLSLAMIGEAVVPQSALADGDARSTHTLGIDFGIFSDPWPSLWSVNLGWNVLDFLRLNVGYGNFSLSSTGGTSISTSAIGGGIKMFVPGWNLSPYVGYEYSDWSVSGAVTLFGTNLSSKTSVGISNIPVGLDWQTNYGLDLSVGYDICMTSIDNEKIPGMVNFAIGYYFPSTFGL